MSESEGNDSPRLEKVAGTVSFTLQISYKIYYFGLALVLIPLFSLLLTHWSFFLFVCGKCPNR